MVVMFISEGAPAALCRAGAISASEGDSKSISKYIIVGLAGRHPIVPVVSEDTRNKTAATHRLK